LESEKAMIKNLQALRAIAAMIVVIHHMMLMEPHLCAYATVLPQWFFVGSGGVDLFFVISGFIMVLITRGYKPGFAVGSDFLYKRIIRIYPLYWIYSAVLLLLYFLQPDSLSTLKNNHINLLTSFLLIPDITHPLLNVGWTLRHELYFYLVFTGVLLFIRECHMLFFLISWGILIGIVSFTSMGNGAISKVIFSPYTYEFIAGGLIALAILRKRIYAPMFFTIIGFFIACLTVVIFITQEEFARKYFEQPWLRILIFGVPSSLLVYGCVGLEIVKKWVAYGWLTAIGDASYSLYLSHSLIFLLFAKFWRMAGLNQEAYHGLFLAGMLITSIIWGIMSYHFIEKPLLDRMRLLWKPRKLYNA
jgi:peptidoglycan/LPS O-acetylase OafA/YrhL